MVKSSSPRAAAQRRQPADGQADDQHNRLGAQAYLERDQGSLNNARPGVAAQAVRAEEVVPTGALLEGAVVLVGWAVPLHRADSIAQHCQRDDNRQDDQGRHRQAVLDEPPEGVGP